MNKTERIARLYAAWLLVYSNTPPGVDQNFDDAVGIVVDELLAGTNVESWQLTKRWEDCKDLCEN